MWTGCSCCSCSVQCSLQALSAKGYRTHASLIRAVEGNGLEMYFLHMAVVVIVFVGFPIGVAMGMVMTVVFYRVRSVKLPAAGCGWTREGD